MSKLSLVVIDKERHEKMDQKSGPKVNRLIYRNLQMQILKLVIEEP